MRCRSTTCPCWFTGKSLLRAWMFSIANACSSRRSSPASPADKETRGGHAGIYTADAAIELYAEVFERAGVLDKLEAFASFHGADFYRLRRNRGTITLRKETWSVPGEMPFGTATLVPLRAGESVGWRLA